MENENGPKAGWNYRVVRHCNGTLAIHQAIYDEEGKVTTLPHGVRPRGENWEDLRSDYRAMGEAFALPILDGANFVEILGDEPALLPAAVRWELYQEPHPRLHEE